MKSTIDKSIQLGKGATAYIYKAKLDNETCAAKIYHPGVVVDELKIEAMIVQSFIERQLGAELVL